MSLIPLVVVVVVLKIILRSSFTCLNSSHLDLSPLVVVLLLRKYHHRPGTLMMKEKERKKLQLMPVILLFIKNITLFLPSQPASRLPPSLLWVVLRRPSEVASWVAVTQGTLNRISK